MNNDDDVTDAKTEKIFELQQENIRLRGQITYLQEELSKVEDELDHKVEHYKEIIEALETSLGDALASR